MVLQGNSLPVPQMIKTARTIKKHWQGVINWSYQQTSNGILEGFNAVFQADNSKARGYQRFDASTTIIYLLKGKLALLRN
jgi:transposase